MHDRVVVRAPEPLPPEETMLKQTPLHAVHVAAGAKMVDFGGWDMPLHYGSQLEEHHAVRRKAGMFDVSHMRVVDLDGAASRDFLRTLIANDVAKLVPGKALYSCMLTESGTVIDDLIVYWMGADHYRIVVNAATADKDIAWMHDVQHGKVGPKRHFAVSLLPRRELAMIAVQGPRRGASCATSSSASTAMPPTPWTTSSRSPRRRPTSSSSAAPATPAKTAARSCCPPPRGRRPVAAPRGRRRGALRPRRARHAAPRSRHGAVRPGHRRDRDAARIRPGMDRRHEGCRAPSSAAPRSRRSRPRAQSFSSSASGCSTRACCARTRRS